MRAGRLTKRVTIQSQTESRGSALSDVTRTWTDLYTVWAHIEAVSGTEYFRHQKTGADISTRIRIRYIAGIAPKMRVLFVSVEGTQIFEITTVLRTDYAQRELILECTEHLRGG